MRSGSGLGNCPLKFKIFFYKHYPRKSGQYKKVGRAGQVFINCTLYKSIGFFFQTNPTVRLHNSMSTKIKKPRVLTVHRFHSLFLL